MAGALSRLPLLVVLMGIVALAMYLPALHAQIGHQLPVARAFFYSGTITLFLVAMVALALGGRLRRPSPRGMLAALAGAYLLLPLLMAVPFAQALPEGRFLDAWFEMLSSFTTTGATLYAPSRLPQSLHLWRAMAGWGGGFFIILMAVSVLAPLDLGGIELVSRRDAPRATLASAQIVHVSDPHERLMRYLTSLFPVYTGATLILWLGLVITGESSFVALCHAMATLSTSGISPVAGLRLGPAGMPGEMLVLLFMLPALSRRLLPHAILVDRSRPISAEPELRVAAAIVAAVAVSVFLRRWLIVIELQGSDPLGAALHSLWGAIFTAVSFLTTTGFESADWIAARSWSGLGTPGLLLLGLAITGGGVGTAAGGVKLMRIYALALQGQRELNRIVHPSQVSGGGVLERQLRGAGAYIAWVFFMLFAISIFVVTAALALAMPNANFEKLLILAIGALTTTGQLADLAADKPIFYHDLGGWAKAILGLTMIVGRLETLAILALLAPDSWRRSASGW